MEVVSMSVLYQTHYQGVAGTGRSVRRMKRRGAHPNYGAGLPDARGVHAPAAPPEGIARWRLAARALLLVLLCGSFGVGALVDLGLRWFPVFTLLWGGGALLWIGVAWIRLERRAAHERAAQRREGPNG
jgi:hypothetical protein